MQYTYKFTQPKPYAIIIGLDNFNGLQTARELRKHGIPIVGIAEDLQDACAKTNVCEQKFQSGIGNGDCLNLLEEFATAFREPPVLFPCSDIAVLQISRNRNRLIGYRFALPAAQTIETLLDKAQFAAFAQENHLAIPSSFLLNTESDVIAAAAEIRFPAILKPAVKLPRWEDNKRQKIYRIPSEKALRNIYNQVRNDAESLVVQEWIEGDDTSLFTINAYFSRQSEPLCTFISQKIRQWPTHAGVASFSVEARNDDVLQIANHLFQLVDFYGLAYLEFKQDRRDGKLYIIEPNVGRPTGRSTIAEAGGVDILFTMYCDLTGQLLPENRIQKYGNAKWIYLRRDLQSAFTYWRHGQLTIGEWLKSLRGKKKYALLDFSDPLPFLLDFRNAFASLFKKQAQTADKPGKQVDTYFSNKQ